MEIGILVSTFVQQMIEFLISKIMELLKKYLRNVWIKNRYYKKREKEFESDWGILKFFSSFFGL